MKAQISWQGRMSFTATADSGFSLPLDADPSVGGDDAGFRPMEMVLVGLGGCTALDVISILMKKRQDVTAFDVQLHADRAETHPKVMTRAVINYLITGHQVDENAVLRAIELSAEAYCPAQAMLGKVMPIELHYQILEDLGEGQRQLVKSGVYESSQVVKS